MWSVLVSALGLRRIRCVPRGGARRLAPRALLAAAAAAAAASLIAAAVAAEEIKTGDDNQAEPSHATGQSACVGDATNDQGFVDVPADHRFKAAIDCFAYYGITSGTGDGTTFAPDAPVTGAQMASFMAGAARVAGADRDAVLGDFDASVASVTRAGAAVLVARLLVAVTDKDSRPNIEMGDYGTVTIDGRPPDDYFADSRNTQPQPVDSAVSALYELGVARGRPDGVTFAPDEPATRAEVAGLITRALAHTRARPEGVTIQQNEPGEVVVSVRDADFSPLINVPIDTFSVATRLIGTTAFKSDGTCGSVKVLDGGHTGSKCAIHNNDPVSGDGGDLLWPVEVDARGGTTVWAWTGEADDKVTNRAAGLARVDLTELRAVVATGAKVTHDIAEEAHKAHFGTTVTVTVQLIGDEDKNAVPPAGGASYRVTISTWRGLDGAPAPVTDSVYTLYSFTESVDRTGKLTFTLTAEDPDPEDIDEIDASTDEVVIMYAVANAAGNTLAAPTDASCSTDGTVSPRCPVFSDEKPTVRKVEVTTPTKYGSPPASGGEAGNAAIVAVTDQYGQPLGNVGVLLTSSISDSDPDDVELLTRPRVTLRDGKVRIPYLYKSTRTTDEKLGVQLPGPDGKFGDDPDTDAVESDDDIVLSESPDNPPYQVPTTFFWLAEPSTSEFTTGGGACVRSSSVSENAMIVDTLTDTGVVRISYSTNDHLYLKGQPVKIATFKDALAGWEKQIADGTVPPDVGAFRLAWEFRNSDDGITRWLLTPASC